MQAQARWFIIIDEVMKSSRRITTGLIVVSLTMATVSFVTPVSAHSGRTDSSGGHNCNVGACAGTYHYHNGGSAPSTPSYSAPTPAPAPRQPVVTTQTISNDVAIPFKSIKEKTRSEYKGHEHLKRAGTNGVKRVYTEVTLTDGVETSRKVTREEVAKRPESEIILIGTRKIPEAKLTSVRKTGDQGKFNISGTAKKNSEVVLAVDNKRIKRAKTDNKGKFTFKDIKLSSAKTKVQIYNRVKGKESPVSEKSTVNTATAEYKTEYSEKLH